MYNHTDINSEEREYYPEHDYASPEEAKVEQDQVLEDLALWSAMNLVCDKLRAMGLGDLARQVADAIEDDVPF